jgi:hypothetical protein
MLSLKRREFIAVVTGSVAWPRAARAQDTKMHRVGVLVLGIPAPESFMREFRN